MIKSPLRYPGGKSRAVKLISRLIPQFDEFREPFVGGGSVYIYLKQKFPERKFWINDKYENLFHFWKECQYNPDILISKIYELKSKFQDGKELHKYLTNNIDKFDNIKKAPAFFIFNRITFTGTTASGGFSNEAFRKRFTTSSIERVETNGNNVFIFLDPPYYSATKSALYGKNGNLHKGFDHEKFANILKNAEHKWLITYDDSTYIRKLFSFANIIGWDLTYGMRNVNKNSNQIGKELFISNYINKIPDGKQQSLFEYTINKTEKIAAT
jgi:DNA adenine methylase